MINKRILTLKSRINILGAVFLVFFLSAPLVYASGRQDLSLERADTLIREKKFDEAVRYLTEYSRRYPNNMDEIQKRLRYIYSVREDFNRLADELLNLIETDPENSQRIIEITMQLERFEDTSSPLHRSFIARARELAQFNINKNLLIQILEEGRALIDRGEYQQALAVYLSGMEIYREQFYTSGYGNIIEDQVRRRTEGIKTIAEAFPSFSDPVGVLAGAMEQAAAAGDSQGLYYSFFRFSPLANIYTYQQQFFYESLELFERYLEELRGAYPDMGDYNYLAFLPRLITGRAGANIQEGMLGVLEGYWHSTAGKLMERIINSAESLYMAGLVEFGNFNYAGAVRNFAILHDYNRYAGMIAEKNLQLKAGGNPRTTVLMEQQILEEDLFDLLKMRTLEQAGILLELASVPGPLMIPEDRGTALLAQWREGRFDTSRAMAQIQALRDTMYTLQCELDGIIADIPAREAQLLSLPEDHLAVNAVSLSFFYSSKTAVDNMYYNVLERERAFAMNYYSIANGDLEHALQSRREEFARANSFVQGRQRINDDGTTNTDYFPAEGLEILARTLAAIDGDISRGNGFLDLYRGERSEVSSDVRINNLQNEAQALVENLAALRVQGLAMSNIARSQVAQADAYSQEGERLFREAEFAYTRRDLDTSRDRLQRAAERFNSSLSIQESAAKRQTWDTRMMELGRNITRLENEMVIIDVRNLVNSARESYFAGNFEQSENYLLRAMNRWAVTNVDENEEVVYWLGIVHGALTLRSGRVIPQTAPLYPEMSQLLSEARKNFEEGVRYINSGQRNLGLSRFDDARRQIREVKLIYPVNQEAGILELRIEQVTNPASFDAFFQTRLNEAIAGARQRSLESFADLQNLAEINPRYPGISAILRQAEIDMGFRPSPPSQAVVARSRELTTSAARILDGGQTSLFEVALAQINEAISIYPDNTEAMQVKDRLLNRMSAPGTIVLSTQDEAEYQRALRELQAGNTLISLSIVERLLQKPGNRNITKLIELQRRIQSIL